MTTYNTGNPIGSTDARDRLDNSENLDFAVNSLALTFEDRLGVTRDTLEGIYQKSAYYRAGTFDAGYTLTNNRQTLAYGNVEYSWSGAFPKVVAAGSTPATSGGVGAGAWVDRTQDTLRSEINNIWRSFSCVSDVDGNVSIGEKISVENYYLNGRSGNLFFTVVAAGTGVHDGGKYIDLPTSGLQLVQNMKTPYTPEAWGAYGDGTNNDESAIQGCLDYLVSGGKVELRNAYQFSKVYLRNENIELCGFGTLKGVIQCYNPAYATSNNLNLFFNIHNLTFDTPTNANSIELAFCRRGWIKDNQFIGGDSNIRILNVDEFDNTQPWGQQVSRIEIDGNKYNDPNYFIYSDTSAGIVFNFADSIISKNEGRALVEHVYIENIDGLNMFDNVLFFKSFNQSDTVKQNSATIKNGAWLSIHDNKFFEAGISGLKLISCSRYNLHDNLYAFTGQHTEAPALDISGSPIGGAYFSQGVVHDENIEHPSGIGISIGEKSGRLKVHSNNIQRPGASTYYYGAAALSGNRYGIVENSDTLGIDVADNSVSWGTNVIYNGVNGSNSYRGNQLDTAGDGSSVRYESRLRTLTVSGTPTSIDVTNYDIVDLNASGAHSISSIVNNGEKKVVIFRAYNSNTTFVHNANTLNLAGSVNYTPLTKDTLQLLCESSTFALEIGRTV